MKYDINKLQHKINQKKEEIINLIEDKPKQDRISHINNLKIFIENLIKISKEIKINFKDLVFLVQGFNRICTKYKTQFPNSLPESEELFIGFDSSFENSEEKPIQNEFSNEEEFYVGPEEDFFSPESKEIDEGKEETLIDYKKANSNFVKYSVNFNLHDFLREITLSLSDQKQIIYGNSEYLKAINSINNYLTDNQNKINTDNPRIQRKLQSNLNPLTPLTHSFEIHPTSDGKGYDLYILLKKKNGKLNEKGGSKKVKECLRFHQGKWELWVNGTVLIKEEKQLLEIHEECVRTQQINSKHVIILIEGSHYQSLSSDRVYEVTKKSVYSEKAEGTLNKRPGNLEFADIFSLCLTSALGLADIHKAGFIHRDIKFENILFFQKDNLIYAKISDLGIAIKTSEAKPHRWGGTTSWASPEEVLGHNWHQKPEKIHQFKEQCEILKKAELKQIPPIKPANICHQKGDVYALAKAFYEIFNKYSVDAKIEKNKIEAQLLADYFHKIMHSSRENRITSAELVEYLKVTLERLSKEIPAKKWDQLREYCEFPLKQALIGEEKVLTNTTSVTSNTGSDSVTPLRALSVLKPNSVQDTAPNVHQQAVLYKNS